MLFSRIRTIFVPKTQRVKLPYPYVAAPSIMTPYEQSYFRQLMDTYGDDFYIFPQVSLANIVKVTVPDPDKHYFYRINNLRVDFVIAYKETLETVKVIELDEPSHQQVARVIRDIRMEKILSNCGMDLDRVQNYK